MDPWILTYSGRQFWPLNPRPEDIDILDIAHALSNKCRFTGHSKLFYSVAEHSVLVAKQINQEGGPAPIRLQLTALLHDAAEAYLADVPTPIKPFLPSFRALEDKILQAILQKFRCYWPMPGEVKEADHMLLHAERNQVMNGGPPWSKDNLPLPASSLKVQFLSPEEAKEQFLSRFTMLYF